MNLLFQAVSIFCTILQYAILFSVILSWIPGARQSLVGELIESLIRPILNPIRKIIHKSPLGGAGMMLDFSPVFAYIILNFIKMSVQ